jgi:hypothetical protein
MRPNALTTETGRRAGNVSTVTFVAFDLWVRQPSVLRFDRQDSTTCFVPFQASLWQWPLRAMVIQFSVRKFVRQYACTELQKVRKAAPEGQSICFRITSMQSDVASQPASGALTYNGFLGIRTLATLCVAALPSTESSGQAAAHCARSRSLVCSSSTRPRSSAGTLVSSPPAPSDSTRV